MKVDYIDHMGDDLRVVNAARVSFAKESFYTPKSEDAWLEHDAELEIEEKDKKLISYLSKNGHWTPFAHGMVTMRETIPIFLARQRFKHTIGFVYNEVSRRYVDDEPEFYYPQWRKAVDNKKQGSGEPFDLRHQDQLNSEYDDILTHCTALYLDMLNNNVCPEQARMVLPQSMYTSYYVTGSLAAWARAYSQRTHDHAQKEWKEVTDQWNSILIQHFPVSWNALTAKN